MSTFYTQKNATLFSPKKQIDIPKIMPQLINPFEIIWNIQNFKSKNSMVICTFLYIFIQFNFVL